MNEIDYTGWTRTPESIKELNSNSWKRLKWHWEHVWKSMRHRGFYFRWWIIGDLLRNKKVR